MESIFKHETNSKNDETTDPLNKKGSSQFTEDKKMLLGSESSKAGKKDEFFNNQYDGEKIGLKVSRVEDDEEELEFEFDSPEKDNATNINLNKSGDTDKMLDLQISIQKKEVAKIPLENDSPRTN